MDYYRPHTFRHGELSSADARALSELSERVAQLSRLRVAPPLSLARTPAGNVLSVGATDGEVLLKITNTSQTITLLGGATVSGYPAKVQEFNQHTGAYYDGPACWFVGANGEAPTNGTRYLARLVGQDGGGKGIYSRDVTAAGSTLTVSTIDGTTTVINNVSTVKVAPGFNLNSPGAGIAQMFLGIDYAFGTMSASFSPSGSPKLPAGTFRYMQPDGSGLSGPSGSPPGKVFGSNGTNVTWLKAGAYIASFHTTMDFSATSGSFTLVSAALEFVNNYYSGDGPPVERWASAGPASGTSASLLVSCMQFVHVDLDNTEVQVTGLAGNSGGILWSASMTKPYIVWAMKVG